MDRYHSEGPKFRETAGVVSSLSSYLEGIETPTELHKRMLSGYRVWTHTLFGPNWRGTGPDITAYSLWHGSTGRLN